MKRWSFKSMKGVFVLAMLIPGVALAHVHEGYVPGSVVVSPTSVAPGDTVNVQFAYQITHDPDTELVPTLWEVRLDADALNGNRFVGILLADDTPAPTVFGTTTFNVDVDVVIPEATAIGTHTLDIFSAAWDFQPVANFAWYIQQDLGLNQPIEITVGQLDTTPPEITCPEDLTVHVGQGETGAVVDFVVTATDDGSGLDTLVCDPVSGSTFPLGDTVVTCTATDVAGNQAICTFTISVLGPTELVEDLSLYVFALNLQHGIENSLDAKLDSALNTLDDLNENNDVAAVNSLEAFISAVEAQSGKKIPVADANGLIAMAQEIIDLLV